MLLPSSHSGYTTVIFGATLLLLQEYTGGQLPELVPRVPGGPAIIGPCVKMSKATSTLWSLQGLVQLVLAAICYSGGQTLASMILPWFVLAVCVGEEVYRSCICVNMSTGLRAPFQGFSFKHCSTVHKLTDHPTDYWCPTSVQI